MKLLLLNLVPPVPYTWSTSSSSISTMSHLITIIRIRDTKMMTHRPGIMSLSLLLSLRYTEPDMLAMSQPRYSRYGPDTGIDTVVTSDTRSTQHIVCSKILLRNYSLPSSTAPPTLQLTQLKGMTSSSSSLSSVNSPLCHTDHWTDRGSEQRNRSVLQFL